MSVGRDQAFDVIRSRIASYQQHSESWEHDHHEAMACFAFEELMAAGLDALAAINRADEWLRSRVASGEVEYDAEKAQMIESLFQSWMSGSIRMIAWLDRFEEEGFDVGRGERFRSAVREVRGILTPDEEFFAHDALVQLRDEAIDAHRRGETEEIKELSD